MRLLTYVGVALIALPLVILAIGMLKSFVEDLIFAFKVGDTFQQLMLSSLASVILGATLIAVSLLLR